MKHIEKTQMKEKNAYSSHLLKDLAHEPNSQNHLSYASALPFSEEALLIGTTLGSAPASAQRRIQQSLLLAQVGGGRGFRVDDGTSEKLTNLPGEVRGVI